MSTDTTDTPTPEVETPTNIVPVDFAPPSEENAEYESKPLTHEDLNNRDKAVQLQVENSLQEAAEAGSLVGAEAPTWKTHLVPHNGSHYIAAETIARQLNHLVGYFGVIGFGIEYKKAKEVEGEPTQGYFQIRTYAQQALPAPAVTPEAEETGPATDESEK